MTILQAASNGWCVGAQGLFFVMNIVLASVYSNYKRGLDLRASQFQDARHKSLDIAYDILTKHNLHHAKREVSRDRVQTAVLAGLCVVRAMALCSVLQGLPVQVFRELVHELSEYDTVPINLAGSPRELVDAAIENVDQDQNGFISREEFRELCVLLPRGFEQAQHEAAAVEARRAAAAVTCTQQCCPSFHGSAAFGRLRRAMHDKRFELAMLFVVFINSVLILAELRFEYEPDQSQPGSWNISWWEVVELGFSTLYVVEMILKMIVSGWWRYWRRWRNRFDGVISVVSLGAELLIVVPNAYNQRGAIRFIMFVRMLRVLRVFADLEQFSVIFAAFFDLAPAFSKLGTVLFLIMCGFGQVGIPLFGGEIYRGNPVLVRLSLTPSLLCRVQALENRLRNS